MSDIAENLGKMRSKIKLAATAAGRVPQEIKLVAVSKGKEEADVQAALAAGQRVFGENRVQEADRKFTGLRALYRDIELHLIGPLQTNKAEDAVNLFDVIETLDRPKLAVAIAAAAKKTGRQPRCLIEINIGDEPQKSGIRESDLTGFLNFCRTDCDLIITGLMCIPPQQDDARKYFLQMLDLAKRYQLKELSMGMSADYETAIACGATSVRVGTAIFGTR